MTNYDLIIDALTEELYDSYNDGIKGYNWNETTAKKKAHKVLVLVEQFQALKNKKPVWRASD